MADLRLTIKKRSFPSHGRVRLHESRLTELEIAEGDHVDLLNETAKKAVTVTVIADRMVGEGEIRVSEEDLAALGLKEGSEVTVKKTPPLKEKIGAAAKDANRSFTEGVAKLDSAARKTGETMKTETKKAAETVKTTTKKAADSVGKAAAKTSAAVKKGLKGNDDL